MRHMLYGHPKLQLRLKAIAGIVEKVVRKIGSTDKPEYPGGFFCLLDLASGNFLINPMQIGQVANEKHLKYSELSKEKALRLGEMFYEKYHLLSSVSRNEEEGKWGGAICDEKYIWSFSGLSEKADELCMMIAAFMLGQLPIHGVQTLAKISENNLLDIEMFLDDYWE